jgi:hypothetical protein
MANICELLINVVIEDKPKVLGCDETVEPCKGSQAWAKGKGSGMGAPNSPIADVVPPAERQSLTHAVRVLAQNVVSP